MRVAGMENLIKKAGVLIEALPYIQDFRGAVVVVKVGGSAMEDAAHVESVLTDVTFMECAGMKPVIVHGGGKAISREMKRQGIESRFVQGLRVTCERSIAVVEKVMNEELNPGLVGMLLRKGARAHGLQGDHIFRVEKTIGRDPETGAELDWGFVGDPTGVETTLVDALIGRDMIPVITPLGRGPDGQVYNVNADVAAAALAKALKARKLAFLSDVPGLLRDPADAESLMSTLRVGEVEDLIRRGIISGGMLPKVQSGIEAIRAGVRKVHMIDGRMLHSLLLEIFTDKGVGTEIVSDD
jgi:acetylglutamate kinase